MGTITDVLNGIDALQTKVMDVSQDVVDLRLLVENLEPPAPAPPATGWVMRQRVDILPFVGRTDQAVDLGPHFTTWKELSSLPNRTHFSSGQAQILKGPVSQLRARIAMGPGVTARIRAMYYDAQNTAVWVTPAAAPLTQPGGFTVWQGTQDLSDLIPLLDQVGYLFFHVEVMGSGLLYGARIEVDWNMA